MESSCASGTENWEEDGATMCGMRALQKHLHNTAQIPVRLGHEATSSKVACIVPRIINRHCMGVSLPEIDSTIRPVYRGEETFMRHGRKGHR